MSKVEYIDENENPEWLLKQDEDYLFEQLGVRAVQIQNYDYYDPRIKLGLDMVTTPFLTKGKETFEKYLDIIKSKICSHWQSMRQSGLFDDTVEVFSVIIGVLIGQDIPRALAVPIYAIITRRGLDQICKS